MKYAVKRGAQASQPPAGQTGELTGSKYHIELREMCAGRIFDVWLCAFPILLYEGFIRSANLAGNPSQGLQEEFQMACVWRLLGFNF